MRASRCACNSINVIQYTSTQSFSFLSTIKQGYKFRLKVSHLQAYTIFSLPDALPKVGKASGNENIV